MGAPATTTADPPALIGPGAEFEGLLSFRGMARVEGRLRGEVLARGQLVIGTAARVEARIDVDELVVAGCVEGSIWARRRAELLPTARVRGALRTPCLRVQDGGRLDGHCETGAAAAASSSEAPPAGRIP